MITPHLSFSLFVSICPLTILLLLLIQHFLRVFVNYMALFLQNIFNVIIAGDLMLTFLVLGPIALIYPCSCYLTIAFLLIKSLALTLPTIMMIIHAFPLLITFLLSLTILISLILFLFLILLIISQTMHLSLHFVLEFSNFLSLPSNLCLLVNNCYTSRHPHSPASSAVNWFKVTPCDVSPHCDQLMSTLPEFPTDILKLL